MNFLAKTSATSVVIVEPEGSIRQMILDALKEHTFESLECFASLKEFFRVITNKNVDWLITASMIGDAINILHILNLATKHKELKEMQISYIYSSDEEHDFIAKSFELGLLSYHKKSYVKEKINSEFGTLFSRAKERNYNPLDISADYLREFLKTNNHYKSLKTFEENLINLIPGNTYYLLMLAEALFLNEEKQKAKSIIRQVGLIDSTKQEISDKLLVEYLTQQEYESYYDEISQIKSKAKEEENPQGEPINFLNINKIIIIDNDTDVVSHLEKLFTTFGVKHINIFNDGLEAWKYIESEQDEKIDLIISEWKLPGLSTPFLVQRLRDNSKHYSIPVMVISSLIKKEEMAMVREIGIDQILCKPFGQKDFMENIVWLLQQTQRPSDQRYFENKISRLLQTKRIADAGRYLEQFINDDRFPSSVKVLLQGELAYHKKDYKKGATYCLKSLKSNKNDIKTLNLLGKCYLQTKDYKAALIAFEKANQIAPKNVRRLLSIAESAFECNEPERASSAIDASIKIDPTNDKTIKEASGISLKMGSKDMIGKLFKQSVDLYQMIANMNNMAVACAKNGRFSEGIQLYNNAINSLPEENHDLRDIIIYNLSLAHIRANELQNANGELEKLSGDKTTRIFLKGIALQKKVNTAIKSGISLVITSSLEEEPAQVTPKDPSQNDEETSETKEPSEIENRDTAEELPGGVVDDRAEDKEPEPIPDPETELMAIISLDAGDRCCFRIYYGIENESFGGEKYEKKPPEFKKSYSYAS